MASSSPITQQEEETKGFSITQGGTCEHCKEPYTCTIHIDRFKDPRYAGWIKASLCLHLTKVGLHDFVTSTSEEYYNEVKADIEAAVKCGNFDKCVKKPSKACQHCQSLIAKIESSYVGRPSKHSKSKLRATWTNTPIEDMKETRPNCHHNVAKLFMPGQCSDYKTPEDGDCTAVFALMSTCKKFEEKISNTGLIQQLKQSRNEVMHSGTLRIEQPELQQIANRCTTLLRDNKCLVNNTACAEKAKEIEEIVRDKKEVDLVKVEANAIRDQDKAMQNRLKEIECNLDDCTSEELEKAKKEIKEIEELATKKKNISEYYNLKFEEVDKAKEKASDLYDIIEKKNVQKFQNEIGKLKQDLTYKETKLSEEEHAKRELQRLAGEQQKQLQAVEIEKKKREENLLNQIREKNEHLEQVKKDLNEDIEKERVEKEQLRQQIHEAMSTSQMKKNKDAKKSYEEKRDDLQRNLIDKYNEMYLCNPILDAKPNFKGAPIDLFVKQAIEVVRTDETDIDNEVLTLRDVFYDKGNFCREIYVHGEQGVGKSVFCRRLTKYWCDAHTMTREATMSEDTRGMLSFRLLFYLNAEGLSLEQDLQNIDDLAAQMKKQIGINTNVKEFLGKEPLLLIIDSVSDVKSMSAVLDELQNESVILIVGRSNKAGANMINDTSRIDKELRIVGIAEGMENQLIEKISRCLNTKTRAVQVKDFMHKIEQLGLNQSLRMPMVLVQFVLLWNSGIAFGKDQGELYKQMTHRQVIDEHNNGWEFTFESASTFPFGCKLNNCPCKQYGDILWKVSKLAFNMLYSKQPFSCPAFSESQANLHDLSRNEFEICLNAGILRADSERYESHMKFLHKTNQEFFASMHLLNASKKADTSILQRAMATPGLTLSDVLEMDQVLIFCKEQGKTMAQEFTKLLKDKVSDDERVQIYRTSCERRWNAPHAGLIKEIQAVVLAAATDTSKLHLADVRVSRSNIQDLQHVKEDEIQSLFVSSPSDESWHVFLNQCNGLQKLVLNSCKISRLTLLPLVRRNEETLMTIGLYGKGVEMLSLGMNLGGILSLKKLVSIGLGDIQLTHEQTRLLFFEDATILQQLQEIQYRSLTCSGNEQPHHKCCETIDLSKKEPLSKLSLWNLPAVSNVIGNLTNLQECSIKLSNHTAQTAMILCVMRARKLKLFECTGLASSNIDMLFSSLRRCTSLRTLIIQGTDFCDSKEAYLESSLTELECIELHQFKLLDDGLAVLVESLPNRRIQVMLYSGTVVGVGETLDGIRKGETTRVTDDDVSIERGKCNVKRFAFYTRR